MDQYLPAALRLYEYIVATHWNGQALIGPDPGIRFNYRIGRFVKSYLPIRNWNDNYYYLQGQGYWVFDNWRLFSLTGDTRYQDVAIRTSEYMLARQRPDGAWDYPNPEWKGRVATVEGTWGSLGLLESYRHTTEPAFLAGALRWHDYMTRVIGYYRSGDELAVKYFAQRRDSRVPNNSTCVLQFLAALADLTGDERYLQPSAGLLTFLKGAQTSQGEFPYSVPGPDSEHGRLHFQCYQYNAYQCLDLMRYFEITRDENALPLIAGVLQFLRGGLAEDGHARYQCGNDYRAVTYHAAALAAAFSRAAEFGMDGYAKPAEQAFAYVLGLQRPDGSVPHSRREYYVLNDRRSYPRYLSMILNHLLAPQAVPVGAKTEQPRPGERRSP